MNTLLIDSPLSERTSIPPVHQKNEANEAKGCSRGRWTTKIHLNYNEQGRVQKLVLAGGQEADVTIVLDLVQGVREGNCR